MTKIIHKKRKLVLGNQLRKINAVTGKVTVPIYRNWKSYCLYNGAARTLMLNCPTVMGFVDQLSCVLQTSRLLSIDKLIIDKLSMTVDSYNFHLVQDTANWRETIFNLGSLFMIEFRLVNHDTTYVVEATFFPRILQEEESMLRDCKITKDTTIADWSDYIRTKGILEAFSCTTERINYDFPLR